MTCSARQVVVTVTLHSHEALIHRASAIESATNRGGCPGTEKNKTTSTGWQGERLGGVWSSKVSASPRPLDRSSQPVGVVHTTSGSGHIIENLYSKCNNIDSQGMFVVGLVPYMQGNSRQNILLISLQRAKFQLYLKLREALFRTLVCNAERITYSETCRQIRTHLH